METKTKESHDLEDQLVKEQANLEKVMESLKGKLSLFLSQIVALRVIPDSLIYLLVTVRAVPAESAPRGNKFPRSITFRGFFPFW